MEKRDLESRRRRGELRKPNKCSLQGSGELRALLARESRERVAAMPRHAFVTLMTTDSWVMAVEALAYSLRPSAAPLRVLVIPDVTEPSREKLRQAKLNHSVGISPLLRFNLSFHYFVKKSKNIV